MLSPLTFLRTRLAPTLPLRARLERASIAWRRRRSGQQRPYYLHMLGTTFQVGPDSLLIDLAVVDEIFGHLRSYEADYEGFSVLDIGGHKGFFGAYALLHGAARVVSYEPEQRNFAALQRAAQGLPAGRGRWEPRNAAIGPRTETGSLHISDESWSHTLYPEQESGRETMPVSVVAIDEALAQVSEDGRPVLVKLDAEGAECEIVQATSPDAWRAVTTILVDITGCPCVDLVEGTFVGMGYEPSTGLDKDVLRLSKAR